MTKFVAVFAFLLSAVSYSAVANNACGRDCVRIGTWNIQDLGGERRKQHGSMQSLAELISQEWQIDLIALQEINVDSRDWAQLRQALNNRGYEVAVANSGRQQRLAYAWRPPVTLQQRVQELRSADSYQASSNCRSAGLRKPLMAYFRAGQFDFYTVNVHLKSSYGNASCAHQIRLLQSKELVRLIAPLAKRDPDVLLLGDFNASANHASLSPLQNKLNITQKHLLARHSGKGTQGKPGRNNVIDLILIDAKATTEWRKQSTVIYRPKDADDFYRKYSDHRPVWADFSTARDDD